MLQSRTVNNTNLIIWVLGTFVVYERNFSYVNFLPLWKIIMCSLLESNLYFSQKMNPFNCSMSQIIFINVDFKAFFVIFTLLYFCWFYTVSSSSDWTENCYIARIDLEVLILLSPYPQCCRESPCPIYERAENQVQGFVYAKQVLYHLSYISSY